MDFNEIYQIRDELEQIRKTYEAEKASDVLRVENDGKTLRIRIEYCPAVKHLRSTGREVSRFFSYATSVVMETLAEACGVSFEMDFYDDETGAASYHFTKEV